MSAERAKIKTRKVAKVEEDDFPVRLTHPEKVLDAESGLTKRGLAEYFWAIAESMLPHVAHRPLSLVRCPEGSGEQCFFQKHVNQMLPAGIEGVDVPNKKEPGSEEYITLSTREALAGLAQISVMEVHPWGSANEALETPDRIIFDLDPDAAIKWPALRDAAKEVRARLKDAGLVSFLKTTGGKGLHIVAPITAEHEWPEVKEFTRGIALAMERDNPKLYIAKMTKAARVGKIYVDFQRNDRGATSVAPYSPRARKGAPVSMPLEWDELDGRAMPRFAVTEFAAWQARLKSDPWKALLKKKQRLKLGS